MKTLNEKVKEMVKQVVLDSDYNELQWRSNQIEKQLKEDNEFQKLQKAVDDYRLKMYAEDTDFQEINKKVLHTAFRACSKCINEINIPFGYTEDEEVLNRLSTENLTNTDTRISSLICATNDKFKIRVSRKRKVIERIPYTFGEIRKLVEMVNLGILEREDVRKQVRNGKVKR